MVNLIGEVPPLAGTAGRPDTHVHLYGKQARPGRKLGHITLRAHEPETLSVRLAEIWRVLGEEAAAASLTRSAPR